MVPPAAQCVALLSCFSSRQMRSRDALADAQVRGHCPTASASGWSGATRSTCPVATSTTPTGNRTRSEATAGAPTAQAASWTALTRLATGGSPPRRTCRAASSAAFSALCRIGARHVAPPAAQFGRGPPAPRAPRPPRRRQRATAREAKPLQAPSTTQAAAAPGQVSPSKPSTLFRGARPRAP